MLGLAQLYLLQGHLDLCEEQCATLLQTEENYEPGTVVRAPPQACSPPSPAAPDQCGCFRAEPEPGTSDAGPTLP